MSPLECEKWLCEHIPHRLRAALARLGRPVALFDTADTASLDPSLQTPDDEIRWRCATDAIWEGRLAAMRWLIAFVGVKQPKMTKDGKRCHPDDLWIGDLGGRPMDRHTDDAKYLDCVWKGCTQGGSHATHESRHPRVDEDELARALGIIVRHLDEQLYKGTIRQCVWTLPTEWSDRP